MNHETLIRRANVYLTNQSWGWELHPLSVEISPAEFPSFLYLSMQILFS
jgi:hypothetical protein